MKATNPYNYNLPVRPEMFFGRRADVETLMHHLTMVPGDSFALIGGRRMGKTSLLEALLRALQPLSEAPSAGLLPLPIFMDLSGEGIDSPSSFFRTVYERAEESLARLPDLQRRDSYTGTRDAYSHYQTGLDQLLNRIGRDHPRYSQALVYQQRLTENIVQSRLHGETDTLKADRSRIIEQLNTLAQAARGVSFSELCNAAMSGPMLETGHPPAPAFRRILQDWSQTVMVQHECRLCLILLVDECEQIVEQPWVTELYGALRFLLVGRETRSLLKVVLAGSHRFLTQVHQRGSPLRNVLQYHRLSALDAQATHDLIVQPTKGALSEQVAQSVAAQSGGHPFLTQYMMHHLWERGLENATPEIARTIASGFPRERSDFQDWLESLGRSSSEVYRVLSQAGQALREDQIRSTLDPLPNDFLQALDALCYHGLVVLDQGDKTYQVAGQMFRGWFDVNVGDRLGDNSVRKNSQE